MDVNRLTPNGSVAYNATDLFATRAGNRSLSPPPGNEILGNWMDSFNLEDEIRKSLIRANDPSVIALIFLYSVSFLTGLMGNFLVIFMYWRNRRMRTITNSFLLNLAVCDLMVVCICMPFTLAVDVYSNWIYGDVLCKLVNFTQGVSVSSSVLTLSVISAERFLAIKKPLKARAFLTRKRSHRIFVVIWMASTIIVTPELFIRHDVVQEVFIIEMRQCVERWTDVAFKYIYVFGLLVLIYLIPLVTILIGYVKISARLWRQDDHLHGHVEGRLPQQAVKALANRRKIARMLVVLALIFTLTWLPKHVIGLTLDFMSNGVGHTKALLLLRRFYSFALWFALTNSSINPICYCLMSESFQSAYKRTFRCFFRASLSVSMESSLSFSGQTSGKFYTIRRSLSSTNFTNAIP